MALEFDNLLNAPLPPGTKGVPSDGLSAADIAGQGWNLLRGDVILPAAILKRSALRHNVSVMQAYLDHAGMKLAPHGKTTLCPQLFELQLEGGAWGITVATISQMALCHEIGVTRILIANELIGEAECRRFAAMCNAAPDREYYVLVDSAAGASQLDAAFAATDGSAKVLVEIGMPGGRCGVRTVEQALALGRHVAGLKHVELRGVEGYEGLIVTSDAHADAVAVDAYLDVVTDSLTALRSENLFHDSGQVLLSAGGSVYYDLVGRSFAKIGAVVPIVRSGCYVTHDSGFYRRLLAEVSERQVLGEAPALRPALEVWARVLSVPEPGLAVLSAGKRDLSHDIDLPVASHHYRPGNLTPTPVSGWRVDKLSDQHAFLSLPEGADIQVGDAVVLGISHPCTTFDKWPLLFEVDDDYAITAGFRTFF